nr:hypothetical protein Iba_chr05cCG16960 [Ipomoea batatas]
MISKLVDDHHNHLLPRENPNSSSFYPYSSTQFGPESESSFYSLETIEELPTLSDNNNIETTTQVDDHHNHLLPREKENRSDQYLDSSSNDNANVSAFGNVNVASGNEDAQVPGEGSSPMNDPNAQQIIPDYEALVMNYLGVTVDDNSGTNQIENLSNDSRNQVNTNQTSIPNQGDALANSFYGPKPYGGPTGNGEGM